MKSGQLDPWAQATAPGAPDPGQQVFSLSSLNHQLGDPASDERDKLKIIDFLQSQVKQQFDGP